MEREVLENAFAQALDELNDIKKSISEQNQLIKKLMEKMEGFDEKPEQQEVRAPSVDMQPFGAMMTKFTAQLQQQLCRSPKASSDNSEYYYFRNKMQGNIIDWYLADFYSG